jgi:hypothetical protein
VALIDSPSSPIDLTAGPPPSPRFAAPRTRVLDRSLRVILASLDQPLALFPTPALSIFARQSTAPSCKPHLKAIFAEAFGSLTIEDGQRHATTSFGTFTRFMLAGFLTHRAMQALGVWAFEAYPDLQFKLWSRSARLPAKLLPKRLGRPALLMRNRINATLRRQLNLSECCAKPTFDSADAEILALSAALARRSGMLVVFIDPDEGRFLMPLDSVAWKKLQREELGQAELDTLRENPGIHNLL